MNPDQQPNQPTPQNFQTPQQIQPVQAPANDPGQTMGIIALVMSFIIAPAGLVLGIIARSQSKKAGFSNSLALASIIISSMLSLLIAGYFALTIFLFALVGNVVTDGFDEINTISEKAETELDKQSDQLEQLASEAAELDPSSQYFADWQELVSNSGYGGDFIFLRYAADQSVFDDPLFSKEPLDNIAAYAKANPSVELYVVGAINDTDNSPAGFELSKNRAIHTGTELVNRGVPKDQLTLYSGGSYKQLFGYEAVTEASARVSIVTVTPPATGTQEDGL